MSGRFSANAFTLSAQSSFKQQSNGHSFRDWIPEIQGVFFSGRLRTFEVPVEMSTEATGLRHSYARIELTSAAFSRDPLADISCAIPQLDAFRFAASEKADGASTDQS
jgi:hypothetical protein